MSIQTDLETRSGGSCELCKTNGPLQAYEVPPAQNAGSDGYIFICNTCETQIEDPEAIAPSHWRVLNDTMWSEVPAVQVMAWRMLNRLNMEAWARDLSDMLYLDEETKAWAQAGAAVFREEKVIHQDSNGVVLEAGDTVVLIQDLKVKGANFIAKRGTAVRRISLVTDNAEQIEGKVDGQHIVILTQYVKKSK